MTSLQKYFLIIKQLETFRHPQQMQQPQSSANTCTSLEEKEEMAAKPMISSS
jgi:hypothetical protein